MSDIILVTIAALIFVGIPLSILAWAAVLEWRADRDEQQELGDQAHHDDTLRNVRRCNRSKSDA
jgi:hypothetical protein